MYGIIGSAVILGSISIQLIKRFKVNDVDDQPIELTPKNKSVARYLLGGTLFGLGWALIGACPGPLFALLGAGYWTIALVILGSILGTFLYGVMRNKLPH